VFSDLLNLTFPNQMSSPFISVYSARMFSSQFYKNYVHLTAIASSAAIILYGSSFLTHEINSVLG